MTKLSLPKMSEKMDRLNEKAPAEITTGKTICKKICCFVISLALFCVFIALLICFSPPNSDCFCTRKTLVFVPLLVPKNQKKIQDVLKLHSFMDYFKNYRSHYIFGEKVEYVNKIVKVWNDSPKGVCVIIFFGLVFATANTFTFKFPNAAKKSFNPERKI
ncbi:uncharacterized protein NPIL_442601 [Nephila pilipes]|uniref:Uncharacterized protein n=1 Tax=Nephila pilipes TaxID=299642 RepID=A0A8X6J4J4_NEPPI|nr:uncharacterized protein NPIL_442601 [Nephila pilipes]